MGCQRQCERAVWDGRVTSPLMSSGQPPTCNLCVSETLTYNTNIENFLFISNLVSLLGLKAKDTFVLKLWIQPINGKSITQECLRRIKLKAASLISLAFILVENMFSVHSPYSQVHKMIVITIIFYKHVKILAKNCTSLKTSLTCLPLIF